MQIFYDKITLLRFCSGITIEVRCVPGPDYDNHSGSDDYIGKNDSLFIGYFKQNLSLLGNRKQLHEKKFREINSLKLLVKNSISRNFLRKYL